MADGFNKSDAALTKAASHVSAAKADLDGQLNTLGGKLQSLQGAWQGTGSMAFQRVYAQWDRDAKTVLKALNDFEQSLMTAEKTYTAADDASAQAMNKFGSQLGG